MHQGHFTHRPWEAISTEKSSEYEEDSVTEQEDGEGCSFRIVVVIVRCGDGANIC